MQLCARNSSYIQSSLYATLDGWPGKHHVLWHWRLLLTEAIWLAQMLHIVSSTCGHAMPGTGVGKIYVHYFDTLEFA